MAPHVDMRHWVPYSEVAGTARLTLAEFRANLMKFPRSGVLIAIGRMSTIFDFGPEANTVASDEAIARWVPELFPPPLVTRVLALANQGRVVFFQGQLRYLAAEVMRLPKADTEDDTYFPDVLLGPLLLCAAEMLYTPQLSVADDLDKMASLVAMFLPVYEIDSLVEPFMLFTRFYIFLTICIPRLPLHLRTFDPFVEFEKAFGFPLKRYYLFVFAVMMHGNMQRNKEMRGGALGDTLARAWFKHTNLTNAQLDQLFDAVSFTLARLPDTKKPIGFADFEFLRDNPCFRHNGELYCLDYEFAVAKLESGVIWRVRSALPDKKRHAYFSFWGNAFEEYVEWLFEQYANKDQNVFHRSPQLDGTPLCDAIVVCGTTAVLIEAKLGTCAASVRYSGDYMKMRAFLEGHLVAGTDRNVGVQQLVRAINKIAEAKKEDLPACLQGVKKIIPLIITRDDIGSSWMTNGYLNARFQEHRRHKAWKRFTVPPLVSMSIATLERGLSWLRKVSLSDILEQRIRDDRGMSKPFEAASSYISRGTRHTRKHLDVLDVLTEEMAKEFEMENVMNEPSAI